MLATAVITAGGGAGLHWLLTTPRFAVASVEVRGISRVAPDQILAAAAIQRGTNIFKLDTLGVTGRVESLPEVRRADVVRELPNRVVISVEERRPFTLVHGGRLHWMDEEGRLLGASGYEVELFEGARAFLASAAAAPDARAGCVIVDLAMPELGGLDLQAALRASGCRLPLIFITGHGDVRASVQAMKEGAVEFLTKPFLDRDLLNAINQAIERRAANKQQAKALLKLHGVTDLDSLWKAVQFVIESALPDSFVGLTLQHNPIMPMVSRWSQPIPDGMFNSQPIENYLAAHPRSKFVKVSDFFPVRRDLLESDFYRQYMAPPKSRFGLMWAPAPCRARCATGRTRSTGTPPRTAGIASRPATATAASGRRKRSRTTSPPRRWPR